MLKTDLKTKLSSKLKSFYGDRVYLIEETLVDLTSPAKFFDREMGEFELVPRAILNRTKPVNGEFFIAKYKHYTENEVNLILERVRRDGIKMIPGTFKGINEKASFIVNNYGEWSATVYEVIRGSVPRSIANKTRNNNRRLTEKQIKDRIKDIHNDEIYMDFSTYNTFTTNATFFDKVYGKFENTPGNVLYHRQRHPSRANQISRKENALKDYISSMGFDVITSSKIPNSNFEIDIYVPSLKIGFEMNGVRWHSELFKEDKKYHMMKRELCEKAGIRLYQFTSEEWDSKQDIVKSMVAIALKRVSTSIMARKCKIISVDSKQADNFFQTTHLMGKHSSAKHYGLLFNGELVCCIGVKKIKDGLDVTRFSSKLNTTVSGGLSKLIKYILTTHKPSFIQSFVDLRYGNGSSLEQIKFNLIKITLGFRWTNGKITFNRRYCRANMDSRQLSEKAHAKEMHLYKLYDAGQAKFTYYP